MSDMNLEAPEADAVEQKLDVAPDETDDDDADELPELEQLPLEADAADAAEQAVVVHPGDDDYR